MKKLSLSLFVSLMAFVGVSNAQAQTVPDGETDVTTLPWVDKGQGCASNFNVDTGETVFGTDAPGTNTLSYVDVSAYGVIKLYGTPGKTARLFINRDEFSDEKSIFNVKLDNDGVGTFDCNEVLIKQPFTQYIHLNGVKGERWGVSINLSMITVSGDPIQFVEDTFVLADDEIEIQDLTWENQGQGCADKLGEETDATIFGTDAGPSTDGKLSYVDITNYASVKLYGRAGDVVRLFINRAEYPDGEKYEFKVTIGEDGVGTFDLAEVYNQQEGAKYVHLNGVKTAQTWKGSPTGKAKVNHITVVIDIDAITAAYEADEADMNEIVTLYSQFIEDIDTNFPVFAELHAEEFAALTTLVNGLSDALASAAEQAMETGVYVGITAQLVEAAEALMSLSGEMDAALAVITDAYEADEADMNEIVTSYSQLITDAANDFPAFNEAHAEEFAALTTLVNGLSDALAEAAGQAMETGVYVGIQAQLVEATEALMSLSGAMTAAFSAIEDAHKADYDLLEDMYNLIAFIIEDETGLYDELVEQAEILAYQLIQWQNDIDAAKETALTETAKYATPLDANELAQHEAAIRDLVETSGIAAINSVNGNAKFYDLNGRQIQNPTKGQMVIKVANGSAVKVAL